MYYAILSEDVDNSLPLRKQARPAHIDRLNALNTEGRLLVAGPHPAADTSEPGEAGFTGSLVIAQFESLQLYCFALSCVLPTGQRAKPNMLPTCYMCLCAAALVTNTALSIRLLEAAPK